MITSSLYRDIAERTGGNIYVGVVGPVRTGKSTFIKKFMETLVLPNIPDPRDRERAREQDLQAVLFLPFFTALNTHEMSLVSRGSFYCVVRTNIA